MSTYSNEPSTHDLNVSLAIHLFQSTFGGAVEKVDGKVSLRGLVAGTPPIINGYRPDALMSHAEMLWIIETKSFGDFESSHSRNQFKSIRRILDGRVDIGAFLYVFGVNGRNLRIPIEFQGAENSGRLVIAYE